MRIRTVYFKVTDLEAAGNFWREWLGLAPANGSPQWQEFRVGNLNLLLLRFDGFIPQSGRPSCVPVFEFGDREVALYIQRAKDLGARAILEGKDHPDFPRTAAVLVDPFGNEFEVTNLHN